MRAGSVSHTGIPIFPRIERKIRLVQLAVRPDWPRRRSRTIWIVDAHLGDRKRFVVRADDKLTALLSLNWLLVRLMKEAESKACKVVEPRSKRHVHEAAGLIFYDRCSLKETIAFPH